MRTTLTLDDDVAAKLEAEVRRTGRSLKDVVNEAIRTGLLRPQTATPGRAGFVIRSKALGLRAGYSYDNVEELLDHAEGDRRS